MSQHMQRRLAGWLVVSLGALIVLSAGLPSVILEAGKPFSYNLFALLVPTRTALASLADIPTRLFPALSQIILISLLQPGDAMPILHMHAHGYEVLVISPDPVAFEANVFGPRAALAVRIARIERQALLQRLYLAGVRVVNWNVETPLARMQR
jgi:hypothetical protein